MVVLVNVMPCDLVSSFDNLFLPLLTHSLVMLSSINTLESLTCTNVAASSLYDLGLMKLRLALSGIMSLFQPELTVENLPVYLDLRKPLLLLFLGDEMDEEGEKQNEGVRAELRSLQGTGRLDPYLPCWIHL